MVTLHGLNWDEVAVLDLFNLLDRSGQGQVMQSLAVAACFAVAARKADARGQKVGKAPLEVAMHELQRCRPAMPHGWSANEYLSAEVESQLVRRLADDVVRMVLTTVDHDQGNAALLACWADEFAKDLGWHAEMAKACSDEESTYVEPEQMAAFLKDWRDSFMSNLLRAATGKG